MRNRRGFTLIELLIVVSIIGLMMTVTLPISFDMYARYKASVRAQEVMVAIADLRRESFLYSIGTVLSSQRDAMTVNGETREFSETRVRIDTPIQFYSNGTTSGGVINLIVGTYVFTLHINSPLGDMNLEGGAQAA